MKQNIFSDVYCYLVITMYLMRHSGGKPISVNKSLIQISFTVTFVSAMYSNSALYRETALCFLFFMIQNFLQERHNIMWLTPCRRTPYPVCIKKACYSVMSMIWIEKPSPWSFLQIPQNRGKDEDDDGLTKMRKKTVTNTEAMVETKTTTKIKKAGSQVLDEIAKVATT